MAVVRTVAASGLKLCEPLICVGLKSVLKIPDGVVDAGMRWVKERFTDHSLVLTTAVTTAHDRAWQAVALALATDTILDKVVGLFRDGDLKAVQRQIREFVAAADTGLDGAADGLRAKACHELLRLKKAGRIGADGVELHSLDLTRFASAAKVADDAHRAVTAIAAEVQGDAPHLARVLALAPPGGGTPLLAAAFAYFLRRQIESNGELFRGLLADQVRLLTQRQQAGFDNVERLLAEANGEVIDALGGAVAAVMGELGDIKAKLEHLLDLHQVSKKAESPLRVSVTSEAELQRLKQLRDRLRQQPPELVEADLQSMLGDGLAAAGQFADAAAAHAAAADTARRDADRTAEADAAYKQFKDACELKKWDAALAALNRAVALDDRRFRPVPKHYAIDAILGAGSFGVVFKCRNTISFDEDGNELVLALKTFRETDLDRPLRDVFGEAHTLKTLTHENVIRIHDHGFADTDGQQRPFLAMEYVAGVTLEEHLGKNGKLGVAEFTAVFRQIAAALHAAHTGRRQIIHRDLKPANVMLWQDGGAWRVKVIDFGLAVRGTVRTTSLSVPHSQRSSRDRSVTGTIKYAAPEQLGEKPYQPGPWSDVFAFGKTGLESLFGTVQPTPKHWKQLPDPLADLLARCVDEDYDAANPADGRFHGFAPVLDALREMEREADPAAKAAKVDEERARKAEEERRRADEERRREEVRAEAERLAHEQSERVRQAEQAKRLVAQRAEQERREEEARRQSEQAARWEREQREQQEEKDRLAAKLAAAEQQRAEQERQAAEMRAKLCAANLERWKATTGVESWVSARLGGWDDGEWRKLLETLKRSIHWPMDEAAVGRHLESVRARLLEGKQREAQRKQTPPPTEPKWTTECVVCKATLTFPVALTGKIEVCPKCKTELILPTRNGGPSQSRSLLPVAPHLPVASLLRPAADWETRCAGCNITLEFAPEMAGKLAECPECKIEMTLPSTNGGRSLRLAAPVRKADGDSDFELALGGDSDFELALGGPDAVTATEQTQDVPAAIPAGHRYHLTLPGGSLMAFAWCPPGTFTMGSPKSEANHQGDQQQHQVRLTKGFYCGVQPVTQAEWAAVMGNTPSRQTEADGPVDGVSWEDAQAFCGKLSERTGIPVRLPTEAEWEYACRGGTTTRFFWGTQGTLTPNMHTHPWGLTDMLGNVAQWCEDWYDEGYYARSPMEDPQCLISLRYHRVLRGGYNRVIGMFDSAAHRRHEVPTERSKGNGFRVVFGLG